MQVSSSSIHYRCRLDPLSIGSFASNRSSHVHVQRKAITFKFNPIRSLPSQPCSSSTTTVASSNSPFINGSSSHGNFLVTQRKCFVSLRSKRKMRKKRAHTVCAAFEKFTERAIKAILFSQREAQALGKEAVLTQHLLLGLIAEEDSSPDGFLASGVTIDTARETVRSIWNLKDSSSAATGTDDGESDDKKDVTAVPYHHVPFSISVKRVFEAAAEYSKLLGYNFIGPEHLVVALFKVDDGNAGRVLRRLDVNPHHLVSIAFSRLQKELAKDGREPKMLSKGMRDQSALSQFCVDLTARADEGLIDPVIGREFEVQRIVQILARKTKSNPILLGESGVGKTAIAEGLAIRIADADVPVFLLTKRVMSLDVALLMSGAKERGELEERVTKLIKDIIQSGDVILFIDEVHTLVQSGAVGSGKQGAGLDISSLLKPALGRGQFQCIASTTMDEYRMHFEKDKALARRFQPVWVGEPSEDDAVKILMGLREKYEAHHKCKYTPEAIKAAVHLSARYIADRYLPDKAIDLIDEAGSRAHIEAFKRKREEEVCILSKSPADYWKEIKTVQAMHEMEGKLKYYGASDDTNELVLDSYLPYTTNDDEPSVVGSEEIATVASLWSGIPVQQLTADQRMLLVNLEHHLQKRVIGQEEAVSAISRAVKRSRAGLKDPDRPIAAMLFCGPTGVGKTELAKSLAECYFGLEAAMVRLDMSEYMERHTVSKLIGSPPGYIGYGEGGTLTEAIRRKPFTLLLLDEIEKAHPDVFNILLQLLEDGHLTDSQGRRVSFKNALVIMTSNVGSSAIAKGRRNSIGFLLPNDKETSYNGLRSMVIEELRTYFRPEFLNRIDEVVVFQTLEKTQLLEILDLMLGEVKMRTKCLGIDLEVSESVKDLVCQKGYDPTYGARPLRRAVTSLIEDLLSEAIIAGECKQGDTVLIDLDVNGNPFVMNQFNHIVNLSDTTQPCK
ncbi:chaperone protein ClpD, chloroplastic isoform X2 [Prosopis cineraria]|uniref:chaperone protein ClpD, chloroplastic isoform X2 n=1 Tax=Prosopis cineraria TaxID=364024 RepID=UPI00241018F2|nr:chaperone protein ClpD, chloroplastic isoform X2 [Prosopis cineraria]